MKPDRVKKFLGIILGCYLILSNPCLSQGQRAVGARHPAMFIVGANDKKTDFKISRVIYGDQKSVSMAFRVFESAKAINFNLFLKAGYDSVIVVRDGESLKLGNAWKEITQESAKSNYCEFWVKGGMTQINKRWINIPELSDLER